MRSMTLAEQIAEKAFALKGNQEQCKAAIREFSRVVAEKIRAQSKGHSPEVKRGMLDAARILEQESGERNNG